MIWATPNVVIQYVETGKVKPLAVGSLERVAILPNVPTVAESGIAGFDVSVFFGIAAPSKTPRDLIERLSREIAEVDKMPDMRAKMAPLGYDIAYADSRHLPTRSPKIMPATARSFATPASRRIKSKRRP